MDIDDDDDIIHQSSNELDINDLSTLFTALSNEDHVLINPNTTSSSITTNETTSRNNLYPLPQSQSWALVPYISKEEKLMNNFFKSDIAMTLNEEFKRLRQKDSPLVIDRTKLNNPEEVLDCFNKIEDHNKLRETAPIYYICY